MKRLTALVWKEWHETRIFLWIGLGIFIGLPMVGGLEEILRSSFTRRFEIFASPWVMMFGGFLAILVAVGSTCRDLGGRLEDFWRSRPVGFTSWLLVKYFVGLMVVLLACLLPLALELTLDRDKNANKIIAWFPCLWAALYSLGFLAGCLVRRVAHAVMLALAAMLLVYFLPVILPPLEWLNCSIIMDIDMYRPPWSSQTVEFAAGMLGLAVLVLILSLLAVRLNWCLETGRNMMYGSVSMVLLILFSSAAYQLGTNLPVLQQIPLPGDEIVTAVRCDGQRGFVMSEQHQQGLRYAPLIGLVFRKLDLTAAGIKLGRAIRVSATQYDYGQSCPVLSCPNHPEVVYFLDSVSSERTIVELKVCTLDEQTYVPAQRLWDFKPKFYALPQMYAWHDRLYVLGERLTILDISQPLAPRIISDIPSNWLSSWPERERDPVVWLPPVPELPPRQRLAAMAGDINDVAWDGETLCRGDWTGVEACRLTKLTDNSAFFDKVGEHRWALLERALGNRYYYSDAKLQNGLLYYLAASGGNVGGTNPCISIFDTRGPQPLRLIGHFAAQGAEVVCPLPDGRAIVGGSQLWLVGPPPHRDSR